MSAGVAGGVEFVEETIREADEALYSAKRIGKDSVVIFSHEGLQPAPFTGNEEREIESTKKICLYNIQGAV